MAEGIGALLELLDLEAIEVNIFRGRSLDEPRQRVFGGQVAAQALVAAGRTVDRVAVHSLHSYFLRPGDPTAPILYEVDRIRDGRSFTTRRVVAIQHGRAIFNLQCSFHIDEGRGSSTRTEMPEMPGPRRAADVRERPARSTDAGRFALGDLDRNGLDHPLRGRAPWERSDVDQRREQLWVRTDEPLADDPLLHAAIATFASDLTLVDTILQRHGIRPGATEYIGASLDHCMWFHRPFRADEWLLLRPESPDRLRGTRARRSASLYEPGRPPRRQRRPRGSGPASTQGRRR